LKQEHPLDTLVKLLVAPFTGAWIETKGTKFIENLDKPLTPLFILSAYLMNSGAITQKLIDVCIALIGHIRWRLAHVNIRILRKATIRKLL